jgi:chromosome segregation ATPase
MSYSLAMSPEVQAFVCPRCKRGEFRSLPGPSGKAFCPWCGDAVEAGPPAPAAPPAPPSAPAAPPPPPPPSPTAALEARLAESERRRDLAETELKKELDKKLEIKKVVLNEMARMEASIADANARVRRKDEEHAAALESLNVLQHAKQQEWDGEQMRMRDSIDQAEKARRSLEAELVDLKKTAAIVQSDLGASRVEISKLRAEHAAAEADRADLRRKLGAAEAKLVAGKDAVARLKDVQQKLQDAEAKVAGLQGDLDKRDQRIKELQLLVKTLGERLNQLADRRH